MPGQHCPLIDEAARKLLLRHGFAVTLEFCRLVQALEPPAPVHCIIAVNDTNGTFRRAALAQLHGDAGGTTAFASQALAKTGKGVWMLDSTARMQPAMAE